MAVGIRQTIPFKGVHLLLGNDLAEDKVVVNPHVTDTPCMDQSPDPIEQELPDLYPSCAVTRAMAKKAMLTGNQSDIDLTDSFIGQSFKNEITKSLSHNLPEHVTSFIIQFLYNFTQVLGMTKPRPSSRFSVIGSRSRSQ